MFPGRPGFGARRIEGEDDVDEVIALMRVNYDRVASCPPDAVIAGSRAEALRLHARGACPSLRRSTIRAFLLERSRGTFWSTA